MNQLLYIVVGLVSGIAGGAFGLGGGIIMIPALVYMFGLTQLQAQGTSLAVMLPPIGILAVLRYYQDGNVKLAMAGFICLGFLIGGFIGADIIQNLPSLFIKRAFGVMLFFISLKMILGK